MADEKAIVKQDPAQVPVTVKPDTEKAAVKPCEWDMQTMLATAGTLALTDKQEKSLYAPVNEAEVEIRPDGLVYLPWVFYQARLTGAFGAAWSLIPQGMPKINGTFILWGFHLVIKGCYCGFAIGQQEYYPENKRMTYGDACEAAKSNALMRLCKDRGISTQLWEPEFTREWVKKYGVQVKRFNPAKQKEETIWVKKSAAKLQAETSGEDKPHVESAKSTTPRNGAEPPDGGKVITDKQRKRLYAICKQAGMSHEEMKELVAVYGYKSSKDILAIQYEMICDIASKQKPKGGESHDEGIEEDPEAGA